jgi:hypothetical protein
MAAERSLMVRGNRRRRQSIHGTFPGAQYSDMLLGLVYIAQRREGAQGMQRERGVEGMFVTLVLYLGFHGTRKFVLTC